MLREINCAFIHSHILYGVEIYVNTKSTFLHKLMQLNNELLRILQCRPILLSTVCDLYETHVP